MLFESLQVKLHLWSPTLKIEYICNLSTISKQPRPSIKLILQVVHVFLLNVTPIKKAQFSFSILPPYIYIKFILVI